MGKKHVEEGLKWLEKNDPILLVLAGEIETGKSTYLLSSYMAPSVIEKVPNPKIWWTYAGSPDRTGLRPEVIKTVTRLMSLPASTGSLERNFSTLSDIMTDKRNRLGVGKASKLCTINQALNGKTTPSDRPSRKRKFLE